MSTSYPLRETKISSNVHLDGDRESRSSEFTITNEPSATSKEKIQRKDTCIAPRRRLGIGDGAVTQPPRPLHHLSIQPPMSVSAGWWGSGVVYHTTSLIIPSKCSFTRSDDSILSFTTSRFYPFTSRHRSCGVVHSRGRALGTGEEMFHCYMRGVGISVTMDSFTSIIHLHRVDNTHGLVMEKKEISSTG